MKFPMNLAQPLAGDVRVNFRYADARMAEQFLDHAQVRAMLQQMRREAVPQHAPAHFYGLDARRSFHQHRHALGGPML